MTQFPEAIRETAAEAARLLKHLGARLDELSLDLARDLGEVARDAQAFANTARDQANTMRRATPRAARLAQAAAGIFARHRWLRLRAVARGDEALSADDHRELAKKTADACAQLRGGIAKIGQLASCRPDLIGPIWATELARLQDDVPPIDATLIRARIEAELGRSIADVFATFDDTPLAAASLAQVHAATLLDGMPVAVKVQVPGIEDVVEADIAALRAIAGAIGEVPGIDLATLADELSRALAIELDYVAEAEALRTFAWYSSQVRSPMPIDHASTARVLVMTRIDGTRLVEALDAMTPEQRDPLLASLVDEVAAQILVRGHVHADPHPGNFLVTPRVRGESREAGERESVDFKLALLDFGCTLELGAAERSSYARLVLAIAGNNAGAAARELAILGFVADDPNALVDVTVSLIGALRPDTSVAELDWERAFAEQIAKGKQLGGLTIPRSFVLLGRVLATIAGLLAKYKPRISIHPLIVKHLAAAIA